MGVINLGRKVSVDEAIIFGKTLERLRKKIMSFWYDYKNGKITRLELTNKSEPFIMGATASLYGDIPYSEAIVEDIPKLDKMSDVFSALQTLLDGAIADLVSGEGYVASDADHYYGGDADKWIAVAHSLKARYYLEWAEVDNANYSLALTEADQGIASSADNFKAKHSETDGEDNCWYQLEAGSRAGNVSAGKFLVELLKSRNDPRLEIYYDKDTDGNYTGSDPGEGNSSAGFLNPDTYGSKSWSSEFISWEEMQFISAECQYAAADEAVHFQHLMAFWLALKENLTLR